jgi:putative phosphoesterase
MRIGVVGDTHNNLSSVERIVEIFNAAEVARVVHTGDITQSKVLEGFGQLEATLYGVWGNNDLEREALEASAARHAMQILDGPVEYTWAERRILIAHDPLELEPHIRDHHHLALHGHTHLHRRETIGSTLVFNPGECAGMFKHHNRVGIVDLSTLECELHRLG